VGAAAAAVAAEPFDILGRTPLGRTPFGRTSFGFRIAFPDDFRL
jgi:hypothetical protein